MYWIDRAITEEVIYMLDGKLRGLFTKEVNFQA